MFPTFLLKAMKRYSYLEPYKDFQYDCQHVWLVYCSLKVFYSTHNFVSATSAVYIVSLGFEAMMGGPITATS